MIKLYQFHPAWDLPNASPFCMKVETYLRMANLPYENVYTTDLAKASKGKLPYIEDKGKTIADSGIIIDYLKQTYGDTLDKHLNAQQKALALALQRTIEEHLYWVLVYSRWFDPANWPITQKEYFKNLPHDMMLEISEQARANMQTQFYGHGMGRHQREEIYKMGKDDIDAITHILDDNDFMFGKETSSIDAVVYATLFNFLDKAVQSPVQKHILESTQLVAYCKRMQQRYYK